MKCTSLLAKQRNKSRIIENFKLFWQLLIADTITIVYNCHRLSKTKFIVCILYIDVHLRSISIKAIPYIFRYSLFWVIAFQYMLDTSRCQNNFITFHKLYFYRILLRFGLEPQQSVFSHVYHLF